MKPLVSILIACYNAESWLAETIESAIAQTWEACEIIIVDDGSTDNSLAIAKRYESSRIKVINQPNHGQSAAENIALAAAQGDLIQYLDADDLLAPDKIECQIQALIAHPANHHHANLAESSLIMAGEWARFYRSPEEAQFIPQPLWRDMAPVDWLICAWTHNYMMHGAAWLIPRKVIEQAGPWTESLSLINDVDYFSRVLLASQGIQFCWGARSYYRSGISGSLSGAKSYSAWQSALLSISLGSQSLLAAEDSPRTRQVCATLFQRFIYEAYPDAPDLITQAESRLLEFGPSALKPDGGISFQLLTHLVGWRQAKRWQRWAYQSGYERFNWGWKAAKFLQHLTYQFRSQNQNFSAHE